MYPIRHHGNEVCRFAVQGARMARLAAAGLLTLMLSAVAAAATPAVSCGEFARVALPGATLATSALRHRAWALCAGQKYKAAAPRSPEPWRTAATSRSRNQNVSDTTGVPGLSMRSSRVANLGIGFIIR